MIVAITLDQYAQITQGVLIITIVSCAGYGVWCGIKTLISGLKK